MAAGRIQRWAYFLSGFDYELQYVKGCNNRGADGLSRLPLGIDNKSIETETDYFNFIIEDRLPIDSQHIRKEIRFNFMFSKIFGYVRNGWPSKVDENLKPYFVRSLELSIEQDLLMWGYQVIIPLKFRKDLLSEIHSTHMGSSKMKAIARQYFW